MKKVILMLGCIATQLCFAQSGQTGTGTSAPGPGKPDKKPFNSARVGDPINPACGPKKKDFARPNPDAWQICSRFRSLAAGPWNLSESWYSRTGAACDSLPPPDELGYYTLQYHDRERMVILDAGTTTNH